MKFEIHFEVENNEDYFIVQGESIEEIKEIAEKELSERGLDLSINNVYSREVVGEG